MAQEVKIKLSADGSQVRKEIKLIDQELKEIGGSSINRGKSGGQKGTNGTSSVERDKNVGTNVSTDKVKQEARDKVNRQTLRELTLIRKELQKYNGTNGQGGFTNYSGGGNNGGGGGGNTPALPGPTSGGGGSGSGKNIAKAAGSLLTAAAALKAITSAYNSLKNSAQSAQTGASLAFTTYGSTLAYTDYNQARKDASNLGAPYGYDSATVMNAGEANMSSGAGFTTKENYESDMGALLRTSKAWGIDAGSLVGTSGFMSSIGVTESGSQKKFADLLAESIVEAEMTGREKEQLQVLEQIADNLANRNTTVTGDQLGNSLGMYNALINQNENLKGTRGASLVTTMQDLAAGGNSSLDVLAGFGTTYTGLSGQLELRKLAEENPEQYWAQVYEGVQKYGLGDDYFKKLLYDNTGSISQAEAIMSALPDMAMGTYNIDNTTEGEQRTEDIIENYNNDKISTEERHDVEKQEASDDRGNVWNNITEPFEKFYNWLPDWAKQGVDIGEGVAKFGAGIFGAKSVGQAFGNWRATGNIFNSGTGGSVWKNFWGKGGGATDDVVNDVANSANDVVVDLVEDSDGVWREAGSAVDDVADDVISNSANDVISNTANDVISNTANDVISNSANDVISNTVDDVVANSVDDVISNTVDDVAAGSLKGVFGKALGPLIQIGFGYYNYRTADNDYERSEAVGQTIGGTIGGYIGNIAGIPGSIAGGWAGGELGKAAGDQWQWGKDNYGTGWAGDWNLLSGLWRKNGTSTRQKMNAGNRQYAIDKGGLPSEFGLPEIFDDNINILGDINWSAMENELSGNNRGRFENKWGMNYDKLMEWKDSDEYRKYQEAHGKITYFDTSNAPSSSSITDYDSFYKALQNSVGEDGKYDLSFMNGINRGQAEQWLAQAFPQLQQTQAFDGLYAAGTSSWDFETDEGDIKSWESFMDIIGITGESTVANTDAIEGLTTEVSEMRKWLENKGYSGTAIWTDDYVRDKYNEEHQLPAANSRTTGSLFPMWNNWFSHATGNDYVPYDNYTALLHRGEMVLTADEASNYRQGKVGNGSNGSHATGIDININLNGGVTGMTTENQSKIVEAIIAQINSSGLQQMISNGFVRVQNY